MNHGFLDLTDNLRQGSKQSVTQFDEDTMNVRIVSSSNSQSAMEQTLENLAKAFQDLSVRFLTWVVGAVKDDR